MEVEEKKQSRHKEIEELLCMHAYALQLIDFFISLNRSKS